jgi:hypothetical protein
VERGVCRLCLADGCMSLGRNKHREFLRCPACGLVSVPAEHWTTPEEERARYARHDNVESNRGYVGFLTEVADVATAVALPGARILDFGSGENAVLTRLLRNQGRDCVAYDPLYGLGTDALEKQYDLVVACEVIEHLRELRAEIVRLGKCLGPGGRMVVRTRCYPSPAEIPSWWYARDPTHINFFAPQTLALAAGLAGLSCERTDHPEIVLWR